MTDSDPESLLLERYGQVEQDNQAYNRTIHNSFYFSVAFLVAFVGAIVPAKRTLPVDLAILAILAMFVFWGLGLWNLRAMIDRGKVRERKRRITRVMKTRSVDPETVTWERILDTPEEKSVSDWEREYLKRTDKWLLCFYYGILPLVVMVRLWIL